MMIRLKWEVVVGFRAGGVLAEIDDPFADKMSSCWAGYFRISVLFIVALFFGRLMQARCFDVVLVTLKRPGQLYIYIYISLGLWIDSGSPTHFSLGWFHQTRANTARRAVPPPSPVPPLADKRNAAGSCPLPHDRPMVAPGATRLRAGAPYNCRYNSYIHTT